MLTWQHVINDKSLRDPHYKIELNRYGKIEMSPASNRHVMLQGELQFLIRSRLPQGVTIPECSVQTAAGFGAEGPRAQSRFAQFPARIELPYLRRH